MQETDYNTNPDYDPKVSLRSDLWPTMNMMQLSQQQELVVDKLNKLNSLVALGYSESMRTMQFALERAMQDLTQLINYRSQDK